MAGMHIHAHANTEQFYALARHFKTLRHGSEKPLDDWLDFSAQDTFMRPGETCIGQKCGPSLENLLIRRLDMGVGAHHGAGLTIQMPSHGHLLRRSFRMKIHKDHLCLLEQLPNASLCR